MTTEPFAYKFGNEHTNLYAVIDYKRKLSATVTITSSPQLLTRTHDPSSFIVFGKRATINQKVGLDPLEHGIKRLILMVRNSSSSPGERHDDPKGDEDWRPLLDAEVIPLQVLSLAGPSL